MCYHITVANVPFAPHSCSIRGTVTALHAGAACKISTVLLHDAKTRQHSEAPPATSWLAQPEIATILLSRFQYLTSTHCCVFHYYQRRLRFSFKLCEVRYLHQKKKKVHRCSMRQFNKKHNIEYVQIRSQISHVFHRYQTSVDNRNPNDPYLAKYAQISHGQNANINRSWQENKSFCSCIGIGKYILNFGYQ